MKICAQSPLMGGEYALCGDAFDAPETETDVDPFRFAKPGETVTCDKCRLMIKTVRDEYPRGYRLQCLS